MGTIFLQGLDKLIVYNLVSNCRRLFSNYGLFFGGGNVTVEMKKKFGKDQANQFIEAIKSFDRNLNGNFESLNQLYYADYVKLIKQMPNF